MTANKKITAQKNKSTKLTAKQFIDKLICT